MSDDRLVIALDVGGTKLSIGLITMSGELLWQRTTTTVQSTVGDSLDQIIMLIEEAAANVSNEHAIASIGMAVPGWVNHRDETVWAPNIKGWDHIPLKAELQRRVSWPIKIDADRHAYVLGEAWCGSAAGLDDVIFLAVGTGIGAGIISGGHLIRGRHDLAGCVGWLAVQPDFRARYAQVGCLEAEAAGRSVARKAEGCGFFDDYSSESERSARVVIEAAEQENAVACAILDEVARFLGMGVANLINILNPEMVVLGGGLFQQGDYLITALCEETRRWAQPIAMPRTRIARSLLGENAGLFGAAYLTLDSVRKKIERYQ